jgi:tyrosine-protein phosphatase YwqE
LEAFRARHRDNNEFNSIIDRIKRNLNSYNQIIQARDNQLKTEETELRTGQEILIDKRVISKIK